jgi:hypothetical protein
MEIPKEQVLGLLCSRGHQAQAGHADQELPDNVDLERDSGLLSTLGVDPGELLARSVLAKFGLGGPALTLPARDASLDDVDHLSGAVALQQACGDGGALT